MLGLEIFHNLSLLLISILFSSSSYPHMGPPLLHCCISGNIWGRSFKVLGGAGFTHISMAFLCWKLEGFREVVNYSAIVPYAESPA